MTKKKIDRPAPPIEDIAEDGTVVQGDKTHGSSS